MAGESSGIVLNLSFPTLRGLRGRWEAMGASEMTEIQLERAEVMADQVKQIFHDAAPYRDTPEGAPSVDVHFQDSFDVVVIPGPTGFQMTMVTSQENIRGYLAAGSYDISSKTGKTLHFFAEPSDAFPTGEVFVPPSRQPVHWRTDHQHWEDEANAAAEPIIDDTGHMIASRIVDLLSSDE
jgi:hypothetical protein